MNFGIFRKYQKPLLWATVVFSVLIFATFSGLDDLRSMISGDDPDALGRFVLPTTGEQVDVSLSEFSRAQLALNKLPFRSNQRVTEDDVWRHLMLVEEARALGLQVSDAELEQTIKELVDYVAGQQGGGYHEAQVYRTFRFASPREFEAALRETMLANKWLGMKLRTASLAPADDVYLRWRTDNELFDFDALVFEDRELDDIEDPGDEVLREYFDELPESARSTRFKTPARHDIAYAWLPFETELSTLPEDVLAEIPEPDDNQIKQRYYATLEQFTQEALTRADNLPDDERAAFAHEVKLQQVARELTSAFNALPEEERTTERFAELAEQYGMAFADPEGLLPPDEIDGFEGFTENAAEGFLKRTSVGNAVSVEPFRGAEAATVALVEERVDEQPLTFEEGRDQVLEAWKKEQRDQLAVEFREELSERTKALPDVAEVVESILAAAREAAEERIAADPELTEEEAEQIRADAIEAEQATIDARVSQDEHRVWDELVAEYVEREAVERMTFEDVSRSYAQDPDAGDEPGSREYFVKSNASLKSLGVDAVSQRLRHAPSGATFVVRVDDRTFPDESAMYDDEDGLMAARSVMVGERQRTVSTELMDTEQMKRDYQLEVVEQDEPGRQG